MQNNQRLTYPISLVAEMLGISRNLAYKLAKRGELPGVIKLGQKRIVVSKAAIDRLIGDSKHEK